MNIFKQLTILFIGTIIGTTVAYAYCAAYSYQPAINTQQASGADMTIYGTQQLQNATGTTKFQDAATMQQSNDYVKSYEDGTTGIK